MVERKRHTVSAFSVEVARIIDAALATRRPRWTRAELSRATGIEASSLSRMLKPSKPMLIDELALICDALGLDAGQVLNEAQSRAATPQNGVVAFPDAYQHRAARRGSAPKTEDDRVT